ncbi:hypothetical protein SBRY_30680 [Actinacidiphila bryophytorum]|uniref:Uncharacterized protein n=1 Tax=Actinacidiphila bryophytorum TaxID=1436133 RepID=A0A9W4MH45_9ACTN|nr:hypothetical protein SBRY_30680 [Actinacidiphila bryophytorum]
MPRWSWRSAAARCSSCGGGGRPGRDLAVQAGVRHGCDSRGGCAARRLRRPPGRQCRDRTPPERVTVGSPCGEDGEGGEDGAGTGAFGAGPAADPGDRGRHPGHAAGVGRGRHRRGPADHGARPCRLVPELADAGPDRPVGDPRPRHGRPLRGRGLPRPRAAAPGRPDHRAPGGRRGPGVHRHRRTHRRQVGLPDGRGIRRRGPSRTAADHLRRPAQGQRLPRQRDRLRRTDLDEFLTRTPGDPWPPAPAVRRRPGIPSARRTRHAPARPVPPRHGER